MPSTEEKTLPRGLPQPLVTQAFPTVTGTGTHPSGHNHQNEENFLPKAETAVT